MEFEFVVKIQVLLFKLAEKYVQKIDVTADQKKYTFLLKLFDRAEIINDKKI